MQRHLIFTHGRSGSNYLVSLLNSHPEITNYGEVLGEWTLPYKLHQKIGIGGKTELEYLECLYESKAFFVAAQAYHWLKHFKRGRKVKFKLPYQISTLGIKEFSENFRRRNLENFFLENNNILIINLYRENTLYRYVSLLMLKQTGIIASNHNSQISSMPTKIHVDVREFMMGLTKLEEEYQYQQAMASKIAPDMILHISYEDLFSKDYSEQCKRSIFEFLGVQPLNLESDHKKILPTDLSQIFLNYNEILEALKSSDFQKYLI